MDPLSELLSLIDARRSTYVGLKAGGEWALSFPPPDDIKFNAIISGKCWLMTEGLSEPVLLTCGDCFLLARNTRFSLCSSPDVPKLKSEMIFKNGSEGLIQYGETDDFFLMGSRLSFRAGEQFLFEGLPPVVIINSGSDQASVLSQSMVHLARELSVPSMGSTIMVRNLVQLMLVQVLRNYLESGGELSAGCLKALHDPTVGSVIRAIHAEPKRRWSIEELAKIANISRSTLALRFKETAGVSPQFYITHWRMQLAAKLLRTERVTISVIAERLGYTSDSAFSHTFKKLMGATPRDYRNQPEEVWETTG